EGLQPEDFVFSPRRVKQARLDELRKNRKTKVQPSQANRKKRKPAKIAGEHYTAYSYRRAIEVACDKAFPLPRDEDDMTPEEVKDWRAAHRWTPIQLRKSFATHARMKGGLEAAQVLLGHSHAAVTQMYAARDLELAVKIAAEIG